MTEDFQDGLPSTWSMNGAWEAGTASAVSSQYFNVPGTSGVLCLNDDELATGNSDDGSVQTPEIDLSDFSTVVLSFDAYFLDGDYEANEEASVSISTNSGSSWTELLNLSGSGSWQNILVNLSDYSDESVMISFDYTDGGGWEYGFAIDNFLLSSPEDDNAVLSLSSNSSLQVISSLGEEVEFDFEVVSWGANDLSDFTFNYSLDGGDNFQSMSSSSTLSIEDSEIFTISVGEGVYDFSAYVENSDGDVVSETMSINLVVNPPVPNFTLTDTEGKVHTLHEYLSSGDMVLLDFFASWCGPCEVSTPEVNSVWEDFGSGNSSFQVLGLTTEPTDDNTVVNNLGWGAEYPKFAYESTNDLMYTHYNALYGENGIPLFILICPDTDNPGFSEVSWSAVGWPGPQALETAILDCNSSILSIDSEIEESLISLFPNPASSNSTLKINSDEKVNVEVVNSIGQKVFEFYSESNLESKSVEIPVETFSAGMYSVNVKVGDEFISEILNVIK